MATSSLEELYPYHVVEFIHPGKKPKVRNVDVVASKWIIVDDKKKKLFVKYPPPPYTSTTRNELDAALNHLSDAPSLWQTYTIHLKGKARNLKEAFIKLNLLKDEETAYTMDSNDSCAEVEKKGTELLRQHRLRKEAFSFMSALSESPPSSQINEKAGQLQQSTSMLEMHKTPILKILKSNHSLNKTTQPSTGISNSTRITNTKAKGKENHSDSSESPKAIQEQRNPRTYQNKGIRTGIPLMNNDTSSPNETGSGTSVSKVSASSPEALVDENTAPIQDSLEDLRTENVDLHRGSKQSTETNIGSPNIPDNLQQTSDSAQRNVKVSLYQMLLDQLKNIRSDISDMKNDVKQMKSDIETLKNALIKNKIIGAKDFVGTIQQLCNKFKFKIPFETVEEFEDFNIKLKQDEALHEAVSTVLQTGLDPTLVMSRSIVNMLKLFLTKTVAAQYVAVKIRKDKKVMKNTPFFQCIEGLIKERRLIYNMDTPDKDVISALSAVLSNSGSWYTSRKSDTSSTSSKRPRQKSRKNKMPKENEESDSLTDSDHESHETGGVFSKHQKSYEKVDDESSVASQDSENNDEPAFKRSRFSFPLNVPNNTLNDDGQSSPIIEVDRSLLQEKNPLVDLGIDHTDPLFSTAGIDIYKDSLYEDEFDENYLFQK
ncbi:uncharacterized protein LOC100678523 isoform X1 [Nasonia vitripennis]|uniref:Uncharacterized protein n=1 Tax=Nasonia vitripennis TaxID=7425 RepID=A0A7M7H8U0_NASVI|nr:uncharacterized protein LOC100678523 isoform X1 [Nasonia vitripennis]